ncbi:trimeric intracellular cation channel family protein [Microbaculum marinum]|uniref:Trimeric intracellular cation channel family protein n=1 Tax=Microbaculum marinum TaxID=1764581 RepID=A0AAW9RZQ6_9HYPH
MSILVIHYFFFVAITVEAMTAALSAGRRSMDWFGVAMLGSITALGGGSIRDVLLGHYPLTWVAHPHYLFITCGAALATIPLARFMPHLRRLFLLLDAIGLAVFTVIGCNVALEMGQPVIVVIVAGMITGCLGGVLRDILCNEIPLLFRSELYASVSIVTGGLYLGGLQAGLPHDPVMLGAMAVGLTLRLLALRYGWNMPKFVYAGDLHARDGK